MIIVGSPLQIIIFNLVDTVYRGMNAIFQSLIEPIFKVVRFKNIYLIYLFLFSILMLCPAYFFMPFLVDLIFPKYSSDLTDVFSLLSILLVILFMSKVITYFLLGRESISKMNLFNIKFLLIEIFLVFYWYMMAQITVFEVIELLLLFNTAKIFFLALGKLFPKILNFNRHDD